ncbi:hypothetical protein WN55_03359 [Dufourea novaeangliae]|uniref:Uncharacterized protein n=1 Tax=Dufourea novaeangliae TaxID=178035 RepID=A0A154PL75_DUFNO|nr:hypothetical protein WN55_03359 [Dufourea novaeangliae]
MASRQNLVASRAFREEQQRERASERYTVSHQKRPEKGGGRVCFVALAARYGWPKTELGRILFE